MEQLKAASRAQETKEASKDSVERTGAPSAAMENATAAAAAATASASPFLGVNPLDMESLDEGIRWMMKGRVDSTGLAKYFLYTARDLREGKVSPEQLGESRLGAVYNKTCVNDDSPGNELGHSMSIAVQLAKEALPSCWFAAIAAQNALITPFSHDVNKHIREQVYGQSIGSSEGLVCYHKKCIQNYLCGVVKSS
jgi:hypothetical protein